MRRFGLLILAAGLVLAGCSSPGEGKIDESLSEGTVNINEPAAAANANQGTQENP